MSDSSQLSKQMDSLREQYTRTLSKKLDDLVLLAKQSEANDHDALQRLASELHKLAGSGGTFGFHELSRQARDLESEVTEWLENRPPVTLSEWNAWRAKVSDLRNSIGIGSPKPAIDLLQSQIPRREEWPRIILIEDDSDLAGELCRGLMQFGYNVQHFEGFAQAAPSLLKDPPDVLVVDVVLQNQVPSDGLAACAQLLERAHLDTLIIVLTVLSDFATQLAAARCNVRSFLNKPIDVATLAAQIDALLQETHQPPWRVLIVDDDEVLAEHYRLTLTQAGLLAEKACQPQQALATIRHFNPDMVLLDLYMSECSGAELARIIRFDPDWQSLPIVYLSREDDFDQQTNALDSGAADDFITKPISDSQLVAAVKVRARRFHQLSELMNRDSLTGLLKHTSIKSRLADEVERARRNGRPLSVAMVDIDHFKRINDTYGHPVGDQVIKAIAQLLRQRVRRQDSVGRYGGEEFVVVLPDCRPEDATKLLDDIRLRAADIPFRHDSSVFTVTVSAGVASTDSSDYMHTLLAMADQALYAAKENGRNQVRITTATAATSQETHAS